MQSTDGKYYNTDVMDTEQILRLIQSIPSKKAEPFKLWLAKVGSERIDETVDPELSIDRAIQSYRRLGYSENWINQRIKSIEVRKALTDEWDKSGVEQGEEYAALTDLMSRTWSGMNTREYKKHKGLKKENLRDNMTNTELVLNMLAEVAATDISLERNPKVALLQDFHSINNSLYLHLIIRILSSVTIFTIKTDIEYFTSAILLTAQIIL